MVKRALLLLTTVACFAGGAHAQNHCFTDEVNARLKAQDPSIAIREARLKAEIDAQLGKMNLAQFKTTAEGDTVFTDTRVLHVPIVFHLIHDYGDEYVSDNEIYKAVDEINALYRHQNPDANDVIPTYAGNIPGTNIPYARSTYIQFHLANKDPQGQPTHGITRRRNYVSNSAGDHAKFDVWPPASYINIWIINRFDGNHVGAAAYAYKPPAAAGLPWYDGVIGTLQNNNINYDNTIGHELGHSLNLDHPWGGTNNPKVACGDDDVDDTPPTMGHTPNQGCSAGALYDTECILVSGGTGKRELNPSTKITSTQTGEGILFNIAERLYLDNLNIYPADSGKPFQILLKHKNPTTGNYTTVATYNGITQNNKKLDTFARINYNINNKPVNSYIVDTLKYGISFRVYDSVILNSVRFFASDSAAMNLEPYTIVLKKNGTVINSYSGITTDTVVTPNLGFSIAADSASLYSLEFADNPGAKHETYTFTPINYVKEIPGVIKIVSDTTQGRYNYFYSWKLTEFNFMQQVPVKFVAQVDTSRNAYSLEFGVNPGMLKDQGPAGAGRDTIIRPVTNSFVLALNKTTDTNGYYNFFYDWKVRYGDYYKIYSAAEAYSLFGLDSSVTHGKSYKIDYPDTVNAQNVMDYTYCSKMFTYLQGARMRAALRSNIAFRNNLIDTANLILTGVLNPNGTFAPRQDLPPIADFALGSNGRFGNSFGCAGNLVRFTNKSWNDTVTNIQWTFSNNASVPTASTGPTGVVNNSFATPGWVTVTMVASSNAGKDTLVSSDRVYVADSSAIPHESYFGEFNAGDLDRYPTFNTYQNFTKWEFVNNAGYYDNTSIAYKQFDTRMGTAALTGTPRGDYDDFYTPAFNLSSTTGGNLYLTFFTSGAFRTSNYVDMNDTLEIYYSTNCGDGWAKLKTLQKGDIGNNGVQTTEWTPSGMWNWQAQNIQLPAPIRNSKRVFFRFRYKPGVKASTLYGTGNNFYLDRIHISGWTTDVAALQKEKTGVVLAPNPTNGSASVIIKDDQSTSAQITITDVTGKLVYSGQHSLNGGLSRVEIPAQYIAVKGMYLVKVTTNTIKQTEKLVVY